MAGGKKGFLISILDEQEQTYVQQFMDNPRMREAVKKCIVAGIYETGVLRKGVPADPMRNAAYTLASHAMADAKPISNAEIGEEIRAQWIALNDLEAAFSAMSQFKTEEPRSETENQAR